MSEICCTRLAENTGRKNYAKNRYLRTIAQLCLAISSQLSHIRTIGKSSNSNICSTCPHNTVNFGPLKAEIDWRFWAHPSKFQRVSRLCFITAPMSLNGGQPNFVRCLAVSWAGTLHFWALLSPNRILPGAKFTLLGRLAFSYIGSVTARHSSSRRQLNFAAWDKEGNCGTFDPRLRHL